MNRVKMTRTIEQLSSAVIKKLRSGIAFTNVAHCVEELVLNSVDAGASCIAVNLNLPFYQIQVIDNGCGIEAKQMKVIGNRYATSKCHTLEDLQNLKSGGFRGEALASLKEVSSVLMIESRAASSNETFCKIFTQGHASDPKKSLNSRPSKGTTVSVYDFLYNMPVRKSSVSEALDFEECRKLLQSIALMHPNISFTLKNESTGEMSLQLKKCTSLYHAFLQVFGPAKANNLKNINYQKNDYQISGCISTECHISNNLQFLYVNKRRVLRTKLHKLVNNILNKALHSRQKSNFNAKNLTPDGSSPSKNQCICIFALNIICPYDKYDIIFEPRKTMIEFPDWQMVLKIVEDCLIEFLKKENLYSDPEESEASPLNADLLTSSKHFSSNIQDCKPGLFSNAVRRLQFVPESINLNENSRIYNGNVQDFSKKNLEKEYADLSSNLVCDSAAKSTSSDNTSSFVGEHSSINDERNSSANDESFINPNESCSSLSILNNFKSITAKSFLHKSTDDASFSSNSREAELSLPCRSVFPSENPVMLRVPMKSTLSSMESASSDSNFLKLREKFQFLPKKRHYPILDNKKDNGQTKVCLKSKNTSTSLFSKNPPNNVLQSFDNREKSKPKFGNKPNTNDKSFQCPSISFENFQKKHSNAAQDLDITEKSGSKTTKDKSLQCPSVSLKETKLVSKFAFEKQKVKFPLQNLRQPGKLSKKVVKKSSYNDTIVTADNLLNHVSIDGDLHLTKRLRSSAISNNTNAVFCGNNARAAINDDEIYTTHLSNVGASSQIENISSDYEYDISKSTPVDYIFEPSIVSENKTADSNFIACSSFNLQTFSDTKSTEMNVQFLNVVTELDTFSKCRLLTNNTDADFENQRDSQNVHSNGASAEIFNDLEYFDKYNFESAPISLQSSAEKRKRTLDAENIHSKFEVANSNSLEHAFNENFINSNTHLEGEDSDDRTLNRTDVCTSLEHSNSNHCNNILIDSNKKKSKCDFQNSNKCNENKIKTDALNESLEVKRIRSHFDSILNQNEDDFEESISLVKLKNFALNSLSCAPKDNVTHNVNFNSNPLIGQFPSGSQGFSFDQNGYKDKEQNSEENFSLAEFTSKDKSLDNCLSESEKSLKQNVYLDSNPFTEQFPSVSQGFQKSPEDNVSNCVFPDFSAKLLNMDVEVYESSSQKFSPPVTETSITEISSNTLPENKNGKQKENAVVNETTLDGDCSSDVNDFRPNSFDNILSDYNVKSVSNNESKDGNNHWQIYAEPKSKRNVYINITTGNSTYVVPEQQEFPSDQKTETNKNNTIEDMLNEWDNPMFHIPFEVPSITDNKAHSNISQMCTFFNSYRFTNSTLRSLQVIGQVDCKFIACILYDYNGSFKGQRLLALFDQHAVHERIRLEELKENLYETNENDEKSVKTSAIDPPLQVVLEEEDIRLLQTYHKKLQLMGIHLNVDSDSNVCRVFSVPKCLVHKDTRELRRSVSDSITILQNSIKEWLTSLSKTRSVPQMLPKSLLSVLNYQACRGAVKFGDPLTLEQCKDLLKSLSGCSLPFQCAHGRPSVAPILDLKKIEALHNKRQPPQLKNLVPVS